MKQPIEILREERRYAVPGKSVLWEMTRAKKFTLRAIIRDDFTVNPDTDLVKLGNFEEWRISPTENGSLELTCTWNSRLFQDVMFQTVNNVISQNSCDDT